MDERSGGLGVRFEIILIAESSRFFTFHSINWSVRAINQILVMVFAVFVVRRTSGSSWELVDYQVEISTSVLSFLEKQQFNRNFTFNGDISFRRT